MQQADFDDIADREYQRFNKVVLARWSKLETDFPHITEQMHGSDYWFEFKGAIAYVLSSAKWHMNMACRTHIAAAKE